MSLCESGSVKQALDGEVGSELGDRALDVAGSVV